MIEKFLCITFIWYFNVFVACFISPIIVGLIYEGINGLKYAFKMLLTDKDYYLTVVKPVFIICICIYIICILITLFLLYIVKII